MTRLKSVSSKHQAQGQLISLSLIVLALGLLPVRPLRLVAGALLVVLAIVLAVLCVARKKGVLALVHEFWLIYLVEVELLRSDLVWREVSSDLAKGRTVVELPAVKLLKADEVVRVVAVRNSNKYQDRLLKSDLSAVFGGWIMAEACLNEDKSSVLFTLTRQGADLAYRFSSIEEVTKFAWSHNGSRLPIDRLTDMKLEGHSLLVGQTGSGKTMGLIYLLLFYLGRGWDVVIADPKNSDLALVGRALGLRVETTSEGIVSLVRSAYLEMELRKDRLEGRHKFGRTAIQQGYAGLMLIVDEYASLSLKLDKEQAQEVSRRLGNLVLEGRQFSVYVTMCMQQANAQVLPTSIREQLVNKLVMGASDEQTYVTAFGGSSASEVLAMPVKAGQGWLMTEGRVKPVFVRMPWLADAFIDDVDEFVELVRQGDGPAIEQLMP